MSSATTTHAGVGDTGAFQDWLARAQDLMDAKAKPKGSLGTLEAIACRLAALQQTLKPHIGRSSLLVFGADHGVALARPEISAFPRDVSAPVFRAVVRGQAASAVLCEANGCQKLLAVDVGLAADVTDARPPAAAQDGTQIALVHSKVRPIGSRNFLQGPAMTEEELRAAMRAGAEAVQTAVRGMDAVNGGEAVGACRVATKTDASWPADWRHCVICLGEIGIGNTTAAAALLAALTGAEPEEVCGRGTGVNDAGLAAKRAVVREALAANAELVRSGGALGALRAVGGLELAAIAGAVLEAARLGVPLVVDGFICGAAALAALAHSPRSVGRVLILSHRSSELGASLLLSALTGARPLASTATSDQQDATAAEEGKACGEQACLAVPTPAVLDMGFRLGEGTGAVLMLPLLRSAAAVMSSMASLEEVLAG